MKKRILSVALTLCMFLSLLPIQAWAAAVKTTNDTYAGLTVTGTSAFQAETTTVLLSGGITEEVYRTMTIDTGGTYTLSGASARVGKVGVIVNAPGENVTLKLNGVTASNVSTIESRQLSFITIEAGNVTVMTQGVNSIESLSDRDQITPIRMNGGSLTMNGTGSLEISTKAIPAISIEGGDRFEIAGGTVTAKTGQQTHNEYAAIQAGQGVTTPIVISGGVVTAKSDYGAAIGSSKFWDMEAPVTITGGEVTAKSSSGAAIGSGDYRDCSGAITISGGTVTAESSSGAAIGGGYYGYILHDINISGGTVTAKSYSGAAIGAGKKVTMESNIIISGGTVHAKSTNGAAIGGGEDGNCEGNIVISDATVTTEGKYGIGYGSGTVGESDVAPFTVTITNSNVQTEKISTNDLWDSGVFISDNSVVSVTTIVGEPVEYENSIIFTGKNGTVYGDVTLDRDLELTERQTLTIPEGTSLTIDEGHRLIVPETALVNAYGTFEGEWEGDGLVKTLPKVSVVFKKSGTQVTEAAYTDRLTIHAEAAGETYHLYNAGTAEFYLGDSPDGVKLGSVDAYGDYNKCTADLSVTVNGAWASSQTVTVVFSGNNDFLPNQGTSAPLTVTGLALDGEGTADAPYQIGTAQQLFYFAALVKQGQAELCAELTADIDLAGTQWIPIVSGTTDPYQGSFDGKGHIISNLTMENYAEAYGGLFRIIGETGVVQNLNLQNATISAKDSSQRIGAIAGICYGRIENCHVQAALTITGTKNDYRYCGGIAASLNAAGMIKNCSVSGTIIVDAPIGYMGGICGSSSGTISGCVNRSEIRHKAWTGYDLPSVNAGGICGYLADRNALVIDCVNYGKVVEEKGKTGYAIYVGGIVGDILNGNVRNCLNLGTVSSGSSVGGSQNGVSAICGNGTSNIENCYTINTSAKGSDDNDVRVTAEQLASGEVAAILQAGREDTVWGQDLSGGETEPKLTDDDSERVLIVTRDGETSYEQYGTDFPEPPENGYWVDENGVPLDTENGKLTEDVTLTSSSAAKIILSNTAPTVKGSYGQKLTLTFAQYIENIDEIGGVKSCALISGELPGGLTVDGNTISGTPAAAGQTTVKIVVKGTNDAGAYLTVTFDIEGAASTLDGLKTYNGTEEATTFTYGDTITVKFTPKASGASTFSLSAPSSNQAALFLGDTQLTEPVPATEGTECTITYDTAGKGLQIGNNTLTVRYGGGGNLSASAGEMAVTIQAKALTVTGLTATGRVYDGTTTVALTGGALIGVLNGDDVALSSTGSGTLADANAGTDKSVTVSTLTLSGPFAAYYTVIPPTDVAVTITQKTLTDDMIAPIDDQTYTGSPITPALTVTDGTPSIIKESDYAVGYSDNVIVGEATATITAADGGNYQGSASQTFRIRPGITGDITYTGLDVSQNPPMSEMLYKAGTGTVSYVPGSPAVVTLENATISPAAASGLKLSEAQVVLIGENKIVNPSGFWGIEATRDVEITGDGTLALTGGAPISVPEAGIEITSGTVSVEGLITAKKLVTANLGRLSVTLNDSEAEPFSQCEESGYQIGSVTVIYTAGSKTYQEPLNIADLWWNETRPGYCWEFTVSGNLPTGGTLTLDGITVDASGCESSTPAIILPGGDVEVKLSGSNTVKGTGRTAISSAASDMDDTITLSGPGSLQTNGAVTAQEGFIGSLPLPALTIKYSETPKLLTEPLNFATTWWTETGPGYAYDPTSQTLALQGLTLETEQWVGIAIAPDTTVILTGENSITSATVAIDCAEGGMVLKGNGSLNAKVKNAAIVGEEGGLTVSGDLSIESSAKYATVSCGKMEINGALRLKLTDAERGLTALLCEGDNALILASGYQIEGGKQIISYAPDESGPDMYTVIGTRDTEGNVVLATEVVITKKSTGGGSGGGGGSTPAPGKPSVTIGGNGKGGKVTASRDGSVTITPNEGYEIAKITVNGKGVEIPEGGKLTGLKWTDKVVVTFGEISKHTPVSQRFVDVKAGAWYEDAVQFTADNGLFTGTSDTTFSPDGAMTRGMLVTVLWRLEGSPTTAKASGFADVAADAWYAEAVRWATGDGIVEGYGNGKFGPDDPVTREQLAVMLWQYAKAVGRDVSVVEDALNFVDAGETSEWAIAALKWAVKQGIVTGKSGKTLDPQGKATRAEAAAMLKRFLDK